jgi:alpha-methylacyl-CoA racemase
VTGPLTGIKVIELAAIGPAPFAGMMLADMGAEVVRVDRPVRRGGERDFAASHEILDRGRRSIAVDLKAPRGIEIVLDLIEHCDVLLEGFRPGVTERLGLGPDVALARNPRLVYARMTGWGQDGPQARVTGHDINYVALAGALEPIAGPDGGAPVVPLNMLGDFGGGGMLMAFGIVSALLHAERTGVGQVVDAAIVDGSALLTSMLQSMLARGEWAAPRGQNLFDGGAPYYNVYGTADSRWLSVGAIEPKFFAQLIEGLQLGDQVDLATQNDPSRWPVMKQLFANRIAERTRAEWVAVFAGTDACVAPVLGAGELLEDEHLAARSVYSRRDGLVQPAPAPRFSATPGAWSSGAARVGEHTAQVLAELGMDQLAVDALLRDGIAAQG